MHLAPHSPMGSLADAFIDSPVVIVGAGPAGLAVAACLQRVGVPCVLLERGDRVGMSWHQHYDRLHLHTAKAFSGLPYVPFPRHYPRYPSRLQLIAYLEAYAAHFDIHPHFNQNVVAATHRDGAWWIMTTSTVYRSPNLVIATGYNLCPYQPTWPGQAQFVGAILHSSAYRNGEGYRGKRVLVVGFGNSGGEIAIDLWEHGAQDIVLAVRGPVNVTPRELFGIPATVFAIVQRRLPPRIADALTAPLLRMRFGDLARYGLRKAADGPLTQITTRRRIPLIDVGTVRLIRAGAITVRSGIVEFTDRGVIFADGSTDEFDAVILATGYRPALDTWLTEARQVTDEQGIPYTSGYETGVPGLYFCGFRSVATGLLREISIEAQRIAQAIARPNTTHRS